MKINELPSQDYLHECFDYDPESGLLTWKVRPLHHFKDLRAMRIWNTRHSGKSAGCTLPSGHLILVVNNEHYLAHRVIWKMMTGNDPVNQIDHIDGNGNNNKFINIREATKSQNEHNTKLRKNNTTGFKGVSLSIRYKKISYACHIMVSRKRSFLGYFDTAEEAHKAYCKAALEVHKDFAHFG